MLIQTVKFVDATDLFHDSDEALTDFFLNGCNDFSFGDNNRSLVTKERFLRVIDDIINDPCDDHLLPQYHCVLKRVEALDNDTYIDLEN
jgi:hypothetical protein